MLRATSLLAKKRPPPMGYDAKTFRRKLRSPRASKPWRTRGVLKAGSVELTPQPPPEAEWRGQLGGAAAATAALPIASPFGLRSAEHQRYQPQPVSDDAAAAAAGGGLFPPGSAMNLSADGGRRGLLLQGYHSSDNVNDVGGGGDRTDPNAALLPHQQQYQHQQMSEEYGLSPASLSSSSSSLLSPPPPLTTVPIGNALNLDVNAVDTYTEPTHLPAPGSAGGAGSPDAGAAVPVSLQHLKRRSRREVADSIALPRHLNQLFHKIMGWSEELVELDSNNNSNNNSNSVAAAAAADGLAASADERSDMESGGNSSSSSSPAALRKRMADTAARAKYGLLLEDYEKDRFALEHQLEIAGTRMERKFLEWEGAHVLGSDPGGEMQEALEHKAAIVLESPAARAHSSNGAGGVPVVGRTCCSGCGALLQDHDDAQFGYVRRGDIARYLQERERIARVKAEYARRMAELQAHWEKHGRQVGEEWLDFMTQEEFDAFYRAGADTRPFVCHRCHALEHAGVAGRRRVWSAPDFTEQLRALREAVGRALYVLVVDVTDFPGSMVHNLPGLVSMNNDVIIAVNKMDCVRRRSFRYNGANRAVAATLTSQRYIKKWVTDMAVQFGLPRHRIAEVIPVSARRGWNVDVLTAAIEARANLNLLRPHKPLPTYFIGVANVGKSSLINALAHHLYVPQPPHPASTKVYYTKTNPQTGEESVHWRWYTPPNVNQAEMRDIPARHDKRASKLLTVSTLPGTTVAVNGVRVGLAGGGGGGGRHPSSASPYALTEGNTADAEARHEGVFLFDTPGLLPHWHQRSPLTLHQMRRTLIRHYRNPQCFRLGVGHTLHLGGLAAIDVLAGPKGGGSGGGSGEKEGEGGGGDTGAAGSLLMMVYTASKTRNAIVRTAHSEAFWAAQLGRALDPPGSLEQLMGTAGGGVDGGDDDAEGGGNGSGAPTSRAPYTSASSPSPRAQRSGYNNTNTNNSSGGMPSLSVQRDYLFECFARHRRRPKADIYVCGLGWVAFCVSSPCDVVLRVRTLPGVVHGVRQPLRYNDLRAFRFWPRLQRRSTPRGLADRERAERLLTLHNNNNNNNSGHGDSDNDEENVDEDDDGEGTIQTVVRLTSGPLSRPPPAPDSANKDSKDDTNNSGGGSAVRPHIRLVQRTPHPHHATAAASPLDLLREELSATGAK